MIAFPQTPRVRTSDATVYVVDDDESIRDSLRSLIHEAGWTPQVFASARAFLADAPSDAPQCLVLDMGLPDISGLALQERVAADRPFTPIIVITGRRDVSTTVAAMKAGAFEFLTKPFGPDVLIETIRQALARSRAALVRRDALRAVGDAYATLTGREREVMERVVAGLLNKQIASDLGISIVTVKAHRGNLMRKMAAESVADLVKADATLRLLRARAASRR